MRLAILGFSAALLLAGAATAQQSTTGTKLSQADCSSAWSKLDTGKAGNLTETQASTAVTNFSSADTNKDGKLSQTEFMAACANGQTTGVGSRGMTGSDKAPAQK
jgi:hypothetical protein